MTSAAPSWRPSSNRPSSGGEVGVDLIGCQRFAAPTAVLSFGAQAVDAARIGNPFEVQTAESSRLPPESVSPSGPFLKVAPCALTARIRVDVDVARLEIDRPCRRSCHCREHRCRERPPSAPDTHGLLVASHPLARMRASSCAPQRIALYQPVYHVSDRRLIGVTGRGVVVVARRRRGGAHQHFSVPVALLSAGETRAASSCRRGFRIHDRSDRLLPGR